MKSLHYVLLSVFFLFGFTLLLARSRMHSPAGAICKVGTQKQLLLDDVVVEDVWNLKRVVNRPVKYPDNPIIVADRPWEDFNIPGVKAAMPVLPNTVHYDPDERIFKMWGTIFRYVFYDSPQNNGYTYWAVYLTSRDGIHWKKPELGIVKFKGSKQNNIIMQGEWWVTVGTVIKDNREADRRKRYKMLYTDVYGMDVFKKMRLEELKKYYKKRLDEYYNNGKVQSVVCVAYSPDGIHWTPSQDNPVMYTESDCMNTVFWDDHLGKYVWFMRPNVFAGPWKRRIARTESKDFIHWDFPRTVFTPDELDPSQFYGMPVFYHAGVYFGLLQKYYDDSQKIDIELVFSRDSKNWKRLPTRDIFIGNGPDGSFDSGMVFAPPPVRVGNELWFYYSGAKSAHNDPGGIRAVGLATLKADRLIARENLPQKEGVLLTRPFVFEGKNITINASAPKGSIRTELLTLEGEKISGFEKENSIPFSGDSLDAVLRWKRQKNTEALRGKIVRIKFFLDNARIYAFQVTQE